MSNRPHRSSTLGAGPDIGHHAGEVRRYLRFARLETNHRKANALIVQAKYWARLAWHAAVAQEKRTA